MYKNEGFAQNSLSFSFDTTSGSTNLKELENRQM